MMPKHLLRPRVTSIFDLLTPEVDRLMLLPRGPFVPICIKIGSLIFKILCTKIWQ